MAATEKVKEIEKKLGPLVQLQELSKNTEERLASLNALAEHVSQKAKALEAQKHAVERAVVEANRLNEMVWAMDVQIAKLNEGSKQVARAEDTVARMEKLAQETHGAAVVGDHRARRVRPRVCPARQGQPHALGLSQDDASNGWRSIKKEFDQFDHRLRTLAGSVAESETRMDGVLAKDKQLSAMNQRADELSKSFQTLMAQADEMAHKQGALESLGERLAQVDELGRRTQSQHEALKQSRQDLEQLRNEIADFHKSHAAAAQLGDKLSADRAALEAFGERATALLSRTPELESKMDAVLSKLDTVDEGTKAATRLGELAAELDAQLTRVGARLQFIEKLESRVNNLHVLTHGQRSQADRAARRAATKSKASRACATRSARRWLTCSRSSTASPPCRRSWCRSPARSRRSRSRSRSRRQLAKSVKQDEAVMHDQTARLTELVEQGRTLAAETAERLKQVQGVSDDLGRAGEDQGRAPRSSWRACRPGSATR